MRRGGPAFFPLGVNYFSWRSSNSWPACVVTGVSRKVYQEMNACTMNWMEFGHGWPFDRRHVSSFFGPFLFVSISTAYLSTHIPPKARR